MMEFSSPLAAMHPPQMPSWATQRDLPTSRIMYSNGGHSNIVTASFDFRAMSKQQKSSLDYFSMAPPSRSSSPTISLAADLSSNFHIDNSPHPPTPRRSLFARDMFLPRENKGKERLVTPPLPHDDPTTPPVLESSPAADHMDISPLPHKAPCFVARVTLASPSPAKILFRKDEQMVSPPGISEDEAPRSLGLPPSMVLNGPSHTIDRKRSVVTIQRPSLLKSKTHSTTSIQMQSRNAHNLLPAFQFGQHTSKLCNSSSTSSLADSISELADQSTNGSRMPVAHEMRRTTSLTAAPYRDGSPNAGIARKPTACAQRPRKQVRRSLSMFQHPDEIMNDCHDYVSPPPLHASDPNDYEAYKHKLPHAISDEPDSLPQIQQDTLINVLNGEYSSHYDKVLVVDCRFEYEYSGGHIDGAVNYNDKELLAKQLFEQDICPRTLLIFHCEYSVHRAPRMAKFVRAHDRTVNAQHYPRLSYPEMYILEGGYSRFFRQHRTLCFPQNYVEMEDKDFEQACERGLGKLNQRTKLSRAQTFAFGQHRAQEQSPTSMTRASCDNDYSNPNLVDVSPILSRTFARRLASY